MKGKGNDGTGNIIERDDWETPQWLFDLLDKQYAFTFDACASRVNQKTTWYSHNFETVTRNGIKNARVWMNPPFSKAKAMFEHFFRIVEQGVAIYRCDNMETKVWQEIILPNADWIFIPNKRLNYEGMQGRGSRFPSALIGVGISPPKKLDGHTLLPKALHNNLKLHKN